MEKIQFENRLRLLIKILIVSNLLDLLMYNPQSSLAENIVGLSFSISSGLLISFGLWKRKNWARIGAYLMWIIGALGFLAWQSLRIQDLASMFTFFAFLSYFLFFLHQNKEHTREYFRLSSGKSKTVWIVLGAVSSTF
jgi:hypothetical protein